MGGRLSREEGYGEVPRVDWRLNVATVESSIGDQFGACIGDEDEENGKKLRPWKLSGSVDL